MLRVKVSPKVAGLLLAVAAPLAADEWLSPSPMDLRSPDGVYQVHIALGESVGELVGFKGARKGKHALATLIGPTGERRAFTLLNPVAPVEAVLFDDGTLLAFDNWHNMGYGAVLAAYSKRGVVLWSKKLEEVLPADVLERVPVSVSSRWWRRQPFEWASQVEAGERWVQITLWNENRLQVRLKDGAVRYVSSLADPMPAMLRGVRIGMTEPEFLKVRPAAERFEIFGEPEVQKDNPNPLLVESFEGSPFFDAAMYLFCERRLCAVTLAAVGEGERFSDRQARVLQGALRKWGNSPERRLSLGAEALDPAGHIELEHSKVEPRMRGVLLWKIGDIDILATCAPQEPVRGRRGGLPGEIGITLANPQLLPEELRRTFFESLVPVKSAPDARLFDLLDREARPPLFE